MNKAFEDFLAWTCANEWGSEETQKKTLNNGVTLSIWDSGVLEVSPPKPGKKDIVLSCAVHGNETAPIEICRDIINDIITEKQTVIHRTLFLIANPASINKGERFVEENMNRLFSGAHSNGKAHNKERERAAKIEQYVKRFYETSPEGERERLHYDLHTAIRDSKREKFAVYPFTHGKPYNKHQLQFLLACGVDTVLLNQAPTTTFSYFSVNEFNAHAFTVELGKVRPFGENDRSKFAAAEQTLRRLISEDSLDFGSFEPNKHFIFKEAQTINRMNEDFELNFADDVANFTSFDKGDLLARDGDENLYAQHDGEHIIFPNAKVALGQRALLTVVRVPTESLELE
ncbi:MULTISPECIES: succinylglutamate desuccinylase [Idiomarina]|uniref:Succinylglutamate desuccinylase n=1 Tax=Idiomarina zobellii TaxID=86103 RepID=A0A837NBI5_9GAMM|nr:MULTISPECIES: succinylglutamate desuccinylase [Idiomarina]KTG23347.1 succinylglutamate desuccinylase [Idiomarina sp. H105]MCH2454370.1 succinylglutamate desuccinylase [Idiomarina sp.]OAE90740.1 succinylglutamate desuccinylase [Idiomarina sp. WRN-38]KPD24982.1 succinylglutamate desuccinylase [Idiomarina zobellii]WPZ00506.1 succinylglutamate desuccinylase [Idiomarina sp. OXR-189]